jgi:hypothetical protein
MSLGRRFATPDCPMVLFAFAVGALSCQPIAIHAQTTELDWFVGKDLWKIRLPKNEHLRLDKIVGKVPKGHMSEPAPWHVWRTNRNGYARYVVLLGEREGIIPGGSSACLQLFDATARRISSWSFQTGWRIDLDRGSIEFSNDLASDLIVLHMARLINGRNVAREYFAISNDRLQFVRMENDKGEAAQNEYVYPNLEIGVVPDASTMDQWAKMLESKDKADVLSALVFLGGRHITEPQRRFVSEPQESKYAELFRQLVGNPRIRELIERLSNSDSEWVRQAALLAARGPRERLIQ